MMDQPRTDGDPMLWNVETVTNWLCSPDKPWFKDPAALAQKIEEQEFDGHALLTFDQCLSRKELTQALGLSTARQQASIVREIISLQAKSRAFQAWKKSLQTDLAADIVFETATEPSPVVNLTPPAVAGYTTPPSVATLSSTVDTSAEVLASTAREQVTEQADESRRPAKKQRVVPIQVDTTQVSDRSLLDPAFRVPDPATTKIKSGPQSQDPFAYLGETVLDLDALTSPLGFADFQIRPDSDGSFTFTNSTRPPPGLRQVVAAAMRALFTKNSRRERLIKEGLVSAGSSTTSADDEHDQEIAWSDLPDELDEETRREIEEEEAETKAREREAARCLTSERVEAILQEAVSSMKARWEEKKLPRYQRQAYKLWTDARKRERTKALILDAHRKALHVDDRIRRLRAEIVKDRWQKEQDVRDQALILEQNLEDKLYNVWLVSLLQSRVQPDKPTVIPKPRRQRARRASLLEDEVLTSDDDMADFIIQDEEPADAVTPVQASKRAEKRHFTPTPPAPPAPSVNFNDIEMIDLTQIDSPSQSPSQPQPSQSQHSHISTPISGRGLPVLDGEALVPPKASQLGNVPEIALQPPKYWAKQLDRWRLVISLMMNRLKHDRRQKVFQCLAESRPKKVWKNYLKLHVESPIIQRSQLEWASPARLLGIDFTLIYLSFLKLKAMSWGEIWRLDEADSRLLKRYKGRVFILFAAFLTECAPSFPTDRQIHRIEAVVGGSEEPSDGQASGRKRVVREVVQDRDALDLRDREERRIKDQRARQLQLRATLANSNIIARDQSRLIINESKEEDQAFMYVNQEIGRRIKDHQVDGVRFLWNSVIRDADVRQGCLLAHTMGLGKTMQVITFLVAISEAANSSDDSVRSLIPEDLRRSQSLILCPPSLVDNWMDEVLLWAPNGMLGNVRKIESLMSKSERVSALQDWAEDGGLLIIGYTLFTSICSDSGNAWEAKSVLETPNLVVADEAHYFKNSSTKGHKACARFKTKSRIALTGTPLANNVDEYYAMIDWVAPNFLGPSKEFNQIYSNPIQDGLEADSSPAQRREALRKLEALKRTVAPKVNRAEISCIRGDLPPKHEFVIFVPPTPLQKRMYNVYMKNLPNRDQPPTVFNMINELTLICAHPRCMRAKAEATLKGAKAKVTPDGVEKEDTGSEEPPPISEIMASLMLKETNSQDMNVPSLSRKVELLLLILDEARRLGDKVLIFSQSIPTLNYLENLLKMQKRLVARLDGSTKMSARHEMIKEFNQGEQEVYLISTKAGGVGLNIHGANRVVLFDTKWNPVNDQQAIGRAYRIGQKKTVYVYRLLVAGSCEEVLHSKSIFKTQLASRLIDKKNPVSWGKRLGVFDDVIKTRPSQPIEPFLNRDVVLDKLIGHRPKGEAISWIVSSDTFEEEDHSAQMTAEDKAQVEEFMRMEEIRRTDPTRYEWELGVMQMRQLAAPRPPYAGPIESNAQMSARPIPGQPMDDRTSQALMMTKWRTPHSTPISTPAQPVAPAQMMPWSQSMLPVPPPIPGANTYFAGSAQPVGVSPTITPPTVPESVAPVPQPRAGGIFSLPSGQSRESFEGKLAQKLGQANVVTMLGSTQASTQLAGSMTAAIFDVLRSQGQGFLYENLRWSLLEKLSDDDRFVLAVASGLLRLDILASVTTEELERRASSLTSLSEQQFEEQLQRVKGPDHSNLVNIGRSNVRTARGMEDLAVMRQTAQRRQRLPNWANEALAQDASIASPGFTNGSPAGSNGFQ